MTATPTAQLTRHTGIALLSGLLLWAGFLVYGSTGHDDSHINFWNVHTLLTRGELVNYNGERVEQTTSLLQDLITASLAIIAPVNLVTLGYLVDIVAAFGCCLLGTALASQLAPALASWLPLLILSSSSFLLWTYGGMGAALTAFWLLLAIRSWWQWFNAPQLHAVQQLAMVAITATLVLVRPEMPVVAVAITSALLLVHGNNATRRRRGIVLFIITALAAFAVFFWQHVYFGSWLPVPAVAKQGGAFGPQLERGTRYLLMGGLQNPVLPLALLLSVIAGWSLWRPWRRGPLATSHSLLAIVLCSFGAYGGFVWTAGGDWMQAARFLVPVVIPASLLLLQALSRLPAPGIAHALAGALVALQFAIQYPAVATISHGIPAWVQTRLLPEHQARYSIFEQLNQEHVRDMAVIDRLANIIPPLHQHLQRPVQLMSGQAGMVFFYTASQFGEQVHFRDLRGLVESSLTLCPLLRDIPRSPQGLFWGYREFFAQLPALEQQCGIQRPDIIYDLNDMNQKMGKTLEALGYTLVHKENGFVVENATGLPWNRLLAPNMIFVRTELLPLLDPPAVRTLNYAELPLQARWPSTD